MVAPLCRFPSPRSLLCSARRHYQRPLSTDLPSCWEPWLLARLADASPALHAAGVGVRLRRKPSARLPSSHKAERCTPDHTMFVLGKMWAMSLSAADYIDQIRTCACLPVVASRAPWKPPLRRPQRSSQAGAASAADCRPPERSCKPSRGPRLDGTPLLRSVRLNNEKTPLVLAKRLAGSPPQ
jgi:hypothetical protein